MPYESDMRLGVVLNLKLAVLIEVVLKKEAYMGAFKVYS